MNKTLILILVLVFVYACGGGGGGSSGGEDSVDTPASTDPIVAIFDEARFDSIYGFGD
jgi:hypothetical protein